MNGYLDIVNVLIQANSSINLEDNTGNTPLIAGIKILILFVFRNV